MKQFFYISLVLVLVAFSGCGKDDPNANNGNNNGDNNGNNGSSNNSTGSNNGTVGANNGSNNGTVATNNSTAGSNNASNNTTGGTGGTGGTTGTNNLTGTARFIEKYEDVICDISFNCTGRAAAELRRQFGARFASEAECNSGGIIELFQASLINQIAGESSGRLTMDDTIADACLNEFRDVQCNGGAVGVECEELFIGNVPEHGLCAATEECAGDSRCTFGDGCEGVCEPRIPATCDGVVCQQNEYCDLANPQSCQPRVGNGGTCNSTRECLAGSGCLRENGVGTCTPYNAVPNGSACSFNQYCGNLSVCESNICEPMGTPNLNEQCSRNDDCAIGTLCSNISFISNLGTCLPPRTNGESCISDNECVWGLFCDGVDRQAQTRGTCIDRRADGETCRFGGECASAYCESDVCTPLVACIP